MNLNGRSWKEKRGARGSVVLPAFRCEITRHVDTVFPMHRQFAAKETRCRQCAIPGVLLNIRSRGFVALKICRKEERIFAAMPSINDKQLSEIRNDQKMKVYVCEMSLNVSSSNFGKVADSAVFPNQISPMPDGRKRAEISSVGSRPCREIKRIR